MFAVLNCEALLQQTLANLQRAIGKSGAVIIHDPLPVVMADPLQLGQVFQHLPGNALKFCGAAPPRVHIATQREGPQ